MTLPFPQTIAAPAPSAYLSPLQKLELSTGTFKSGP